MHPSNIFKRKEYSWWQIGILKLAILAIGIVIGANWPGVFAPYSTELLAVGIILGIYLLRVWLKNK